MLGARREPAADAVGNVEHVGRAQGVGKIPQPAALAGDGNHPLADFLAPGENNRFVQIENEILEALRKDAGARAFVRSVADGNETVPTVVVVPRIPPTYQTSPAVGASSA